MLPDEIDEWLFSLSANNQLRVFQALSEYMSVNELKNIMSELAGGRNLLSIHTELGLVKKYYVDLLRIKRLIIF